MKQIIVLLFFFITFTVSAQFHATTGFNVIHGRSTVYASQIGVGYGISNRLFFSATHLRFTSTAGSAYNINVHYTLYNFRNYHFIISSSTYYTSFSNQYRTFLSAGIRMPINRNLHFFVNITSTRIQF